MVTQLHNPLCELLGFENRYPTPAEERLAGALITRLNERARAHHARTGKTPAAGRAERALRRHAGAGPGREIPAGHHNPVLPRNPHPDLPGAWEARRGTIPDWLAFAHPSSGIIATAATELARRARTAPQLD